MPELLALFSPEDTTEVVSHAVVQRSRYLVLFEQHVVNISKVFYMFTSYPFSPEGHRATLGSWSNKTITSVVDLFPDRYPDLQGAVLYLASWCDDFPIIYVSGDGCIGSSLDTLSLIAHKLNFTYEVQRETQDQHWGALENGNWTGMLGDLKYNGKDLALNWFLLNHNRWKAFDALYPYYAEGFGFLARLPEPAPRWKNLTYSFTTNLWLIIVCSTMVVSCMFSALMPRHMTEGTVDHIQQIILVCAGVVRQVVDLGGDGRWAWQRVWLGWWWLGCIILTTAYTCNLIAFLTVPVYTTRIETVAHLAASDLRVIMQDYGSFLPEALKESSDPHLYTLGHKLDLYPYEEAYDPAIYGVLNRTHALTETYSYLMNLQIQYNVTQDTYLMKEQVYPGHMSWFMPKNTPYSAKVSALLTRLREAGVINKFFLIHFARVSETFKNTQESTMQALSIKHLQGAFLLHLLGLVAALLILLLELFVFCLA
ncbi:glutamate receptor ionotropic, delta-1-like isoform X2 [Homarus americanus]|uniref:glutamate receptor ionotropic, delta-1-like isoform X2 n=1 Tax=Homarus americanus TaxID=6706 RepID=UPI001C481A0D|nr:glutamate receptor ionotropic, delta-1-like isoform X2 [Homarus americanus]